MTHFGRILAKSMHQGGGAAVVFEMRRLKMSLNIRTFLFRFKTMEMQRGYKFVTGKTFSGMKGDFSQVFLDSRR